MDRETPLLQVVSDFQSTTTSLPSEHHAQPCFDIPSFHIAQLDNLLFTPAFNCSSASSGGCMDLLFRQLACRYVPSIPYFHNCVQNVWDGQYLANISYFSPESLVIPQHTDTSYSDSNNTSRIVKTRPSSTLWIAVACVCTDTQAARGIIHLLSCAGFSVDSFLQDEELNRSKIINHPDLHNTVRHSVSSHHTDKLLIQPLIMSAAWPLPTARIPGYRCASLNDHDKLLHPSRTNSYRSQVSQKIQNGQIHVGLMSHHKVSSRLT